MAINTQKVDIFSGTYNTSANGTAIDISLALGACVQAVWTNTTGSAKTAVTGTSEVHTLNFADKSATTNGDYISITDTNGDKWAASLSVNGIREVSEITCIAEGSVKEVTNITCIAEGGVKERTSITCVAEGQVKERTSIACVADVGGSLDQSGFVIYDSAGSVAVWISVGGSTPTPAWTGDYDRALKLTITSGDSAATIAGLLSTLLTTDANWTEVSNSSGTLVVQDANFGTRVDAFDVSSTFTITTPVQGAASVLDGKYFVIYGNNAGTVESYGVWFNSDATGSAPAGAVACDNQLEVTLSAGDANTAVASALSTALTTTTLWTEISNAAGVLVVEDAKTGVRTDATAGDSTFTISVTVQGVASALNGTYFKLPDSGGTVGFWFDVDNSGTTTEPAHGCTRAVKITTVNSGMTNAQVQGVVYTAVDDDSKFASSGASGASFVVTDAEFGTRATAGSAGTSGFTVARSVAGVTSYLTGKYFKLGDVAGVVTVWFDVGNEGTSQPTVAGTNRYLEVTTLSRGDTAAQVATKLRTALDSTGGGDSKFIVGTLTDATFRATCVDYKSVANINAGDSGFTVSTITQGADLCAAPTGAIWSSIAAGKKCQVDISSVSNDEDIAPLVKTAMDLLSGFTDVITLDHSAGDGTMLITHTARQPVTIAVPKNADDSGAGSIAVADTTNGVVPAINLTNNTITVASHGWSTGLKVQLSIGAGSLPAGLAASEDEFIIVVDANTVKIADTLADALAGTARDITDYGTVAQTITITPTSIAGGVIHVEASNDPLVGWEDISGKTANITATGSVMFHLSDAYYRYFRVVLALTAGQITLTTNAFIKGE